MKYIIMIKNNDLYYYKNIRSTTLNEFWGRENKDFIFLSLSANRNSRLTEIIDKNNYIEFFKTKEDFKNINSECLNLYYKILPDLSNSLNIINNVNLSVDFWKLAFGYWFYRHICNIYDKYSKLSKIDLKTSSIKILDSSCFYIPSNHEDYIYCFADDFGVEQLVSQFYILNGIKKETIFRTFKIKSSSKIKLKNYLFNKIIFLKSLFINNKNVRIGILGVLHSKEFYLDIYQKSNKRISNIHLPNKNFNNKINLESRKIISQIKSNNLLEKYLIESLVYCIPKDFIENFNNYYSLYNKFANKINLDYILSEDWISNTKNSIFISILKEKNIKFISFEHGYGTYFYDFDYDFLSYDSAYYYLTLGWNKKNKNTIKGGFIRSVIKKQDKTSKFNKILFVSRTVLPFETELIDRNSITHYISDLVNINNFINLCPQYLKKNFVFRPRNYNNFGWNNVLQLNLLERGIKLDNENFTKSITESKIIIIDHISTALAEIILSDIPFIIILDINKVSLYKDSFFILKDFESLGLLHLNSNSAILHLNNIYSNIDSWWHSEKIRNVLRKFKDLSLSTSDNVSNFLISLLN
jgi:putative transferase (TIGR04331 family)